MLLQRFVLCRGGLTYCVDQVYGREYSQSMPSRGRSVLTSVANVEYMYSSTFTGDDDRGNGEPDEGPSYTSTLPPNYSYQLVSGALFNCSMGNDIDDNCVSVKLGLRKGLQHSAMGETRGLLS